MEKVQRERGEEKTRHEEGKKRGKAKRDRNKIGRRKDEVICGGVKKSIYI
jgi:hypothetical protein